MDRKMSEPEAWDFLARLWSEPHIDPSVAPYVVLTQTGKLSRTRMYSLCHCVRGLYQAELITLETLRAMLRRMRRHKPRKPLRMLSIWGYWWPLSRDGARARAEFCRKLAERARSDSARTAASESHRPVRLSSPEATLLTEALRLWLRTEGLAADSRRLQTARNAMRALSSVR